jgi:hypothetical protein
VFSGRRAVVVLAVVALVSVGVAGTSAGATGPGAGKAAAGGSGADLPVGTTLPTDLAAPAGDLQGSIIGPDFYSASAVPWIVSLNRSNDPNGLNGHFCGGTLVGPDLVFTAAHCVTDSNGAVVPSSSIDVIAGRTTLSTSSGQRIRVKQIYRSPAYSKNALKSDYAILRLSRSTANQTAGITTNDAFYQPGQWTFVAGWGCTIANHANDGNCPQSDSLKGTSLVTQSDAYCKANLSFGASFDGATNICAQDPNGVTSSCFGDSGGPLTEKGADNRWYLIGAVSWGEVKCTPSKPTAFAWTKGALPWMMGTVLAPPQWNLSSLARSTATDPSSAANFPYRGYYTLDAYGGIHPWNLAPKVNDGPYWLGWDISRGLALSSLGRGYVLDGWGGLHPFGGAPAARGPYWPGWDIARGVAELPGTDSGVIIDGYGGIHSFGGAQINKSGTSYWNGWDITRGIALLPNGSGGYTLDAYGGIHPFGAARPARTDFYLPGQDLARGITLDLNGKGGWVIDVHGVYHPFTIT